MAYDPKDYYFQKAKREKYAARSIFKLQEIDERFRILKPGNQILDLGAAPGSWSQYASGKIGSHGKIVGIDLQPIPLSLPNAIFIRADLRQLNLSQTLEIHQLKPLFDVILSDMAPKTTGIRITDQTRSIELGEIALQIAENHLRPKGHFVCKIFHGEDFQEFRFKLRQRFNRVEILRPKSTRKESKEVFFIALHYTSSSPAPQQKVI